MRVFSPSFIQYSRILYWQSPKQHILYNSQLQQMILQKRDIKILISADCHGRIQQLIPKIQQLHQKNNFNFMLLLGDVCHPRSAPFVEAVKSKKIELPLPLYFIDSSPLSPILHSLHPQGIQLAQNLTFLGESGLTTIQGVQIAYFSNNTSWKNQKPDMNKINSLIKLCQNKSIDILLTNEWSVAAQSISEHKDVLVSEYVSQLVGSINPHYHLAAGGDKFYRMSPYKNGKNETTHFISVAPFQQQTKDKYLYGLTVRPNAKEPITGNDPNVLQNPYVQTITERDESSAIGMTHTINNRNTNNRTSSTNNSETVVFFEGFPEWAQNDEMRSFLQRWGEISHFQAWKDAKKGMRCGNVRFVQLQNTEQCLSQSGKHLFHSSRIKFSKKTLKDRKRMEDCWFCKSKGDKSLIIYQGKFIYISLEKGPLSRFHLQFIPFNHVESSGRLDREEIQELQAIINRLKAYFTDQGYQVVTYERCLPLSEVINHCVIHFLPIKSQQSFLKTFQDINKQDYLKFSPSTGERRNFQHFLKLNIGDVAFMREVNRKEKIQADFMRQLLCQILNAPRLVNWKMCERSADQLQEQRRAVAVQLKQAGVLSA